MSRCCVRPALICRARYSVVTKLMVRVATLYRPHDQCFFAREAIRFLPAEVEPLSVMARVRAQGRLLCWQSRLNPLRSGALSTHCSIQSIAGIALAPDLPNCSGSIIALSYCIRSGNEPLNLRSIVLLSAGRPSPELDDCCVKTSTQWPARLYLSYTRSNRRAVGV